MVVLFVLMLATAAFSEKLSACENTYPANGPFFTGNYLEGGNPSAPAHPIQFVSFNINYALSETGLHRDFQTIAKLNSADFILLQEVAWPLGKDENIVKDIAQTLKMAYVFAPGCVDSKKTGLPLNYGNAVLSRWPIVEYHKVLLPDSVFEPCNQRTALAVTAIIDRRLIKVYSVHLSTMFPDTLLFDRSRARQLKPALEDIAAGPVEIPVFLAGDFNSVNFFGLRRIEKLLNRNGFQNVHPSRKWTFKPFHFTLDHAYARRLRSVGSGSSYESIGSDHIPIWADVFLGKGPR